MKIKKKFSKALIMAAIISLFFETTCIAQIDDSKQFLYLQTGEVIYSNNISQKQGLFKDYLIIENRRFELKEIKFINQGNGLYANTRGVFDKRKSLIAERIEKGAINVFEMEVVSTMRTSSGTSTTHRMHYFINKDYDNIAKMNLRNLVPMLEGNSESMLQIEKARGYYKISMGTAITAASLIAVGFGVFGAGLVKEFNNDDPFDNKDGFDPKIHLLIPGVAIGIGFGLAIPSNIFHKKYNNSQRNAIDIYNKASINK